MVLRHSVTVLCPILSSRVGLPRHEQAEERVEVRVGDLVLVDVGGVLPRDPRGVRGREAHWGEVGARRKAPRLFATRSFFLDRLPGL